MRIKYFVSTAVLTLVSVAAGAAGILSQEPFALWPLIFLFVGVQIHFVEQYRKFKLPKYKIAFIIAWVTYAIGMCYWLTLFGATALIAFVGIQALFGYLFFLALRSSPKKIPIYLIYPIYFVLFEAIQSRLPYISFTWLTYSTTLVDTPFSRLARIGGGSLLSFLIVFVSASIYQLILYIKKENESSSDLRPIVLGITSGIFIILFLISPITLYSIESEKVVTTVQGNDKNRYLTAEELRTNYIANSHLRLAAKINFKSDIFIFPESAFNDDPENDSQLKSDLKRVARKSNGMLIMNSIATVDGLDYNRNYFYDNKMNLLGTYDKKRLVPFGEYVPFNSLMGSLSIFDEIGSGFVPGKDDKTIRGVTTLICYESAFSSDVRNALNEDSRLLVITTNNRSYRRTGNSLQHRKLTQLRSIENGIASVHSSVSGSSALIERDGRIVSETSLFEKKVITAPLSWGKPDSLYHKIGDWLPVIGLLVVIYLYLSSRGKQRWRNLTLKK